MVRRPCFYFGGPSKAFPLFLACMRWYWWCHLAATAAAEDEVGAAERECQRVLPMCVCNDYEVVTGLSCRNVTDFGRFTSLLSGSELFPANTTYELEVTGVRELPRGFLAGLIVFRLYVDDPSTEEVDEAAFEGVLKLRRFHSRLSSIRKVPNFSPIRDSLRNINLENGLLTALDGTELQNLPLVETLSFVNNTIRTVAPDAFQGTEEVIIFDISHNLLQSLPPHLFDSWKKIMKVVLSYNNFLHVDQLFARVNPQFIYLDSNNLTDLDSVLHPGMSQLETLQLSRNPLGRVTERSFNGKANSTRFLFLDGCGIAEFDVAHYADLAVLSTLDLSYNRIEVVTRQTVSFGYKIELIFIGNRIRQFNAELPFNVRRVYLSNNELTSLGSTLQFSQMTEVSMADNQIAGLGAEDFRGVHGVQVLDLQGNRIRAVERSTFQGIRKDLTYLDLSRNRIVSLNGCVRSLSLLTSLNLTDNLIQKFEPGEFTGLNELSELYLSNNLIVQLDGELQRLPQLQYLVISGNSIRTIRDTQIPPRLKFLYLRGNPLVCNCELYPFLTVLNSTEGPGTDVPLCIPSGTVRGPRSSECPEECDCACAESSGVHYIAVNCSRRGLETLPSLFLASNNSKNSRIPAVSRVSIQSFRGVQTATLFSEQGPYLVEDEIGALDLSGNALSGLESARLPPTLRRLMLSGNRLGAPVESVLAPLENLRRLSLSHNPWECDCGALDFKKWILSKSDIVVDLNETKCDFENNNSPSKLQGRLITSLMDTDLCPPDIGLYISLAFGILSFCLTVTALKIVWIRYEMNIKVWLYAHGVTWVKEKDIDRDKQFDAFFSFSHKDENFVIKELVRVIEQKAQNVRLCLHYKHFMAGEFIHDNIMVAVQSSKRTVLVLSKSFLESEWCMMEFRAAHVQALKDRVARIIVIKVGELPPDIDPALKLYLDSTTYLTWGEKYFWDNLLYILPTSAQPNAGTTTLVPHTPVRQDTES